MMAYNSNSHKRKTEKPSIISGNVDINMLSDLIKLLDGYTINRLVDFRPIDKSIREGKLGKSLINDWKTIERNLRKMSRLAGEQPDITRLMKMRSVSRILVTAYGTCIFAFMILSGLGQINFQIIIYFFMVNIFIIPLPVYAEVIFLRRIARKIDELFEGPPERFKMFREHLRTLVQDLIYEFACIVKNRAEDPSKHELRLYTANYEGIRIKKKPSRFDRCYTVTCNAHR